MRPTLLLLLVVGLVSCIPREGLARRLARDPSAEGGGDGSSSLALRSSSPDGGQGKEHTKRGLFTRKHKPPKKNETKQDKVREKLKKLNERKVGASTQQQNGIDFEAVKSYVYEKTEYINYPEFWKQNLRVRDVIPNTINSTLEIIKEYIESNGLTESLQKQSKFIKYKKEHKKYATIEDYFNYIKKNISNELARDENQDVSKLRIIILDLCEKFFIRTGTQSRPKRGFFGKLKSKFGKSKKKGNQSKSSRQQKNKDADDEDDDGNDDDGNDDDEDDVDDDDDDDNEDEDEDEDEDEEDEPPRRRPKNWRGKGSRSRRKRFKRGELLERALRNFIVLSSHLDLNVTQNKTTPSADTMIKEVEEDQPAGKTDSRRSLGPVGGSEAQGGENDAQVDEVMDGGQKDEAEENNQEINAMVQENDDDDDDK